MEAVAARWSRRPLVVGAVAGALIGTVGFAAEYAWTQVAFPLSWTTDIVVEGVLLATLGGVAGGVLAGLLVLGLAASCPSSYAGRGWSSAPPCWCSPGP